MVSLISVFGLLLLLCRGVHALRSIMGSQGKFAKRQSSKINVYRNDYISIPISYLEMKHTMCTVDGDQIPNTERIRKVNGFCISLLTRSIQENLYHGASKELKNPCPEWISRFL